MHEALYIRGKVLQAVREWFDANNFLEVQTPVRISCPAPEVHLDAFPSGAAYLRTSPELGLKRLLAKGYERIYELGPCFRADESGPRHLPEFTMLEWYRGGATYEDSLRDTQALLRCVAERVCGSAGFSWQGRNVDLGGAWHVMSVREVFETHAGWDPLASFDADRFDLDLIEKVEPALPSDRPVVLRDYPAEASALARVSPASPPFAERWEVYIAGIELANAYTELTDGAEQRRRFESWNETRVAMGKNAYPLDDGFLADLAGGRLPPCSGVALGIDRLVMLLANAESVKDVVAFHS